MVNSPFAVEPVAPDRILVWIKFTKEGVWNGHFPDAILYRLPVFNYFRTFYGDFLPSGSLINDPVGFIGSAVFRDYQFPIGPFMYRNEISRFRFSGGFRNRFKRFGS